MRFCHDVKSTKNQLSDLDSTNSKISVLYYRIM